MAYLLSRGRGDFTSNYMAIMPKDKFIVLIVRFHNVESMDSYVFCL